MLVVDEMTHNKLLVRGCKWISTEIIDMSKVYVPKGTNEQTANRARKKTKLDHVNMLVNSLEKGIDYTKRPPIVKKEYHLIDGVEYSYSLVAGFHRHRALEKLGKTEWIFDVYEVGTNGVKPDLAQSSLQIQENDHSPELANTQDDIVNIVSWLISKGHIKNTEVAITDYIEENTTNMHGNTMAKTIKKCVRANGSYQDIATYEADYIADINAKQPEKYVIGGEFDRKRKKLGISVLETYELPLVMKAVLNYSEHDKETYFLFHTKLPSDKVNLKERRQKMIKKLSEIEKGILSASKFYEKNGHWPWHVEAFMGQNKKPGEEEKIYLSVEEAIK